MALKLLQTPGRGKKKTWKNSSNKELKEDERTQDQERYGRPGLTKRERKTKNGSSGDILLGEGKGKWGLQKGRQKQRLSELNSARHTHRRDLRRNKDWGG